MTKFAFIRKLSRYFLCVSLLLFGNAWCASSTISICYIEYEVMKMNSCLSINISADASSEDNINAIKTDFESKILSCPPGKYVYLENRVFEHIKDPLALLTLRGQLNEIWNASPLRDGQFHIIEADLSGAALSASEPVFVISSVPTIYIYKDEGVSDFSARICEEAVAALESCIYATQRINAEQTISGEWRQNAAAFFMPGGADLSFCKKLNGAGNAQIKAYVTAGGTYIGFCAGAYYGSHDVEFNKGDVNGGEVIAERELSFFPGTAVGPVLAPFTPTSKEGVRIANIKWIAENSLAQENYNVYYNGGCYFRDASQYSSVHVLATYANEGFEGLAAIINCQVREGKAVLSGVHPEYSAANLATLQNSLSPDIWNYMQEEIMPRLSDGLHKEVFKMLIEQI